MAGIQDFLRARFLRGQFAQTFEPIISVGGVNDSSSSLTYDVNHYDASGNLKVNAILGAFTATANIGLVGQSGSWTVSVRDSSGNPALATNTSPTWVEQAWITRPIIPSTVLSSLTSITGTAASVIVAATDGTRKGVLIVNDTIQAFFLKYGLTASTTSYSVRMPSLSYWEMPVPVWQGRMDGIWDASNTGAARVTILS